MAVSQAALDLQVAYWPLSSWTVGKTVPSPHGHWNLRKCELPLPVSVQRLKYNEGGLPG